MYDKYATFGQLSLLADVEPTTGRILNTAADMSQPLKGIFGLLSDYGGADHADIPASAEQLHEISILAGLNKTQRTKLGKTAERLNLNRDQARHVIRGLLKL